MRLLSMIRPDGSPGVGRRLSDDTILDFGPPEAGGWTDIGALLREPGALTRAEGLSVKSHPVISEDAIRYAPVIPKPEKIFCVGVNYHAHRAEMGRDETHAQPMIFTRFAHSLVGHKQPIVRPEESSQLDYEGELAVIIGRPGRRIPAAEALSHVAGYSAFNDASVRDYQRHTSQFTPGKNFDATGGFGPCLCTADEIEDPQALQLQTIVAGETLQSASTALMMCSVAELIAYISSFCTLAPGDVIVTGTPGGVGLKRTPPRFLQPGEEVRVEIEGVGRLVNPIAGPA